MRKLSSTLTVLGFAALLLVPIAVGNPYYIHLVETILIYAIVIFGLDIVVGHAGQVSLGHAGLFGVGAYTAGVLATKASLPLLLAIPAAIGVTAASGAILALPALRVSGPYLAMVTLAFGTIVQVLINEMDFLTNGPMGIKLPKPVLFGVLLGERGFYWLVAALMAVSLVVVHRVLRSHIGRAFEAQRGSPVASGCMGVSVHHFKVYAFVISAGLAGLAGALYAWSEQYISPNTYNAELTVLFLLAVIMGGRKSRVGSIVGAAIIVLLPKLLDDVEAFREVSVGFVGIVLVGAWFGVRRGKTTWRRTAVPIVGSLLMCGVAFQLQAMTDWRLSIFGAIMLFVVYYLQDGIVGFLRGVFDIGKAEKIDEPAEAAVLGDSLRNARVGDKGSALLEARQLLMQFGGLKALNQVDLCVRRGSVHGLIGPNGSGKSTMMNVLTGIYVPTAGTIEFDGRAVVGRTSSEIAQSGIARTFQNVQLFGEMTVLENVQVGLHHTFTSGFLDVVLHTPRYRRESRASVARAMALLRFVGLGGLAAEQARNLPYGKQRLLEIARALALDPQLLLLDEPAAGLTAPDIRELTAFLHRIRDHGITVILIEHHMELVMSVCDTLSVLDFGQKIAEGAPSSVQNDARVVEAYLGAQAA